MNRSTLEGEIPPGHTLLLDTTTLIAYLNGTERVSALVTRIVDEFVHPGRNAAVVSTVTVMEVLVEPLRRRRQVYRHVLDFLTNFPNVRTVEVSLAVAQEAAAVRATHNLRAPDALIVGTALAAGVRLVVTNEADWHKRLAPLAPRLSVVYLADHL